MRIHELIYFLTKTKQKYGNIEVVIPPQPAPNVQSLHGLTVLSTRSEELECDVMFVALCPENQVSKEQTL
jgi:hypothetical protein